MSVIGVFARTKDGGWTGTIRTLLVNVQVKFVPNDNQPSEAAPAYRIFAGRCEIGAAWCRQSAGAQPREYLSVRLTDPTLSAPISAALFAVDGREEAHLVWDEKR